MPASPSAPTGFRSLRDMWRYRVESTPSAVAFFQRRGSEWHRWTWADADVHVQNCAMALIDHGIAPEDRVAILGGTSVHWILADFALLTAGAANTAIYPTHTAEECRYLLKDSGAKVVFVDQGHQAEKIQSILDDLPERPIIVQWGEGLLPEGVIHWSEWQKRGAAARKAHPEVLRTRGDAIDRESLATLIYTSGTTGEPKGVRLTHDAWVYISEAIERLDALGPTDKQLLYLPLAHVFARAMEVTAVRLGIPTAVDGSVDRLFDNLQEVRPTWLAAVPRMFEKAYTGMLHQAASKGAVPLKTLQWALDVARTVAAREAKGVRIGRRLTTQRWLADRLVFQPLRAKFGGRIRFVISGGAPLDKELGQLFHAIGIPVLEGYGLTESTAASCVNHPDRCRMGTVGQPLQGCEVRIAKDGEILLKSRGIMEGYHNKPEATARALTHDGWLRTGDLGQVLPTGHLMITGRKKELIVTSGGKNIAPAHVENKLVSHSPLISHVLVHGDRRNFCTALITLDRPAVNAWAQAEGIAFDGGQPLSENPRVQQRIAFDVDDVNRTVASYEQVKKFHILEDDFTPSNGLLTPSLKVKRSKVEAMYHKELDALYNPRAR